MITDEELPQRIRETALRLIRERGFAGTSLSEIAAAAGVDTGLVLQYFPTRADVLWYGYDETYEVLVATLREHRRTGQVGDAIRAALRSVLDFGPAQNDDIAAHLEVVDRDPALFDESEDRIAAHKQAIIAFIADEIGQRPDDLTPRLVGETVVTAALVATRHWSSAGDAKVPLSEQVDAAVAPLLEGYRELLS